MADEKKIPLGAPLELTDVDLDELAQVTDEDIKTARKLWRKAVDPEIADLLDAIDEGE